MVPKVSRTVRALGITIAISSWSPSFYEGPIRVAAEAKDQEKATKNQEGITKPNVTAIFKPEREANHSQEQPSSLERLELQIPELMSEPLYGGPET